MKLLIVIPSLVKGGAERVAATLQPFFSSHFEMIVVLYHPITEYEIKGKIINMNLPVATGVFGKIKNTVRETNMLRRILQEEKPGLVISFMSIIPPVLSFHATILSLHTHYERMNVFDKIALKTIAHFGHIKATVVPSTGLNQSLAHNTRLKNIHTIENPIDLEIIEKQGHEPLSIKKPFILAAGRLIPLKQFDVLIKTYHRSALFPSIDLVILGEGPERQVLERLIGDLGIQSSVHLVGQVDNPFAYMSQSLFLVLTSEREVLGNVLIESLAIGTPVIAFDCDFGPREIIAQEYNGLLVPLNNTSLLQEAMERLHSDKDLYKKLKNNAKESVSKFSLSVIGKKWEGLIDSVIHHE